MEKLFYSVILVITALLIVHLVMNFQEFDTYNILTIIVSGILIIYSLMKLIE